MKKVLYILHYPPPIHGAAMVGKYIMESELLRSSFRSKYLNLGTSRSVVEIGSGGLVKLYRFLKLIFQVVSYKLFYRPDLVYMTPAVNPKGIYKDFLIAVLVKMLGGKLVYHLHNKGVADHQHKTVLNLVYKFFFRGAKVILLSKSLYQDIERYVQEKDVLYCPNGIPRLEECETEEYKKKGKQEIKLLFLSNLLRAKGVFTLIGALEILKNEQLDFVCQFVGGFGDITAVEFDDAVRKHRLESYVHYAGSKYGKEKSEAYKQADVFVFPSHNETFGLVNLEAMQFSLPIVSTMEGGIPDVVIEGKTGLLVRSNNVTELASKLKELIQDENLRVKMGEAGKKRYETTFTLDVFEENLRSILLALMV